MTPGARAARTLDLTPLGRAVTLRDVREYHLVHLVPPGRRWWASAIIVGAYLAAQMTVIALILPIAVWDDGARRTILGVVALATGAYAALLGALVWRSVSRSVRLDRTARRNGLEYSEREPLSRFAGTPLHRAGRPEASDVVRSGDAAGDRGDLDFAIATFAASPGLLSTRAGVIEIRLERPVPHIVLENRRARILRRSGDRFRTGQRLALEGDFDRTFQLYCPADYERDALYLFTPDLMALLLDLAPDCEVELVDDRILLYSGRPWRLWRPEHFARVLTMIDTIGSKAARRSSRYRDDRVDADTAPHATGDGRWNVVGFAAAGRRLRTIPSLGGILSMAGPLALAAWGLVDLLAH